MKVLAIIPARGGSKGIPRKNIRLLCGKPLLQYTAEAALKVRTLDDVLLSTEDEEIARVGVQLGLRVPFLRPAELAQDDTPTLPVLQHAVSFMEKNGATYDFICLLEPTNPLRTSATIEKCLLLLQNSAADSVMTVRPVPHQFNPHWVYFEGSGGFLKLTTGEAQPIPRRQNLPKALHRDGSVYCVRTSILMKQNSLYGEKILGVPVSEEESINLDTISDWEKAEKILTAKL